MPSSPPPHRTICVLQVIPALDTGGAERATIDVAAALAARGDRALVASQGGRMEGDLREQGGSLIRFPAGSKNPLTMIGNAIRLARLIRAERIDIVHARSRAPAWAALIACRITGVPLVTTFHGSYAEQNAAKRLYNSVMARSDAVIANSAYTARIIAERYGRKADVVVIPRGIDLEAFDPASVDPSRLAELRRRWGLSDRDEVVLHLARLTGWKGQRSVIEAAALTPAGAVFVLAGDDQGRGNYREELERLVRSLGMERRVRVVGHCDDPAAALALSRVAVIASIEPEAFGRAAVEAAAMGIPVVATALGATPETVLAPPAVSAAERTGWLVPAGDSAPLARAIGEALSLPARAREELARRARRHAGRFGKAAMQEATLALYDRLGRDRRPQPLASRNDKSLHRVDLP